MHDLRKRMRQIKAGLIDKRVKTHLSHITTHQHVQNSKSLNNGPHTMTGLVCSHAPSLRCRGQHSVEVAGANTTPLQNDNGVRVWLRVLALSHAPKLNMAPAIYAQYAHGVARHACWRLMPGCVVAVTPGAAF